MMKLRNDDFTFDVAWFFSYVINRLYVDKGECEVQKFNC